MVELMTLSWYLNRAAFRAVVAFGLAVLLMDMAGYHGLPVLSVAQVWF